MGAGTGAGAMAGAATGDRFGGMRHDGTADSHRRPENAMPKRLAPLLARTLALAAAAGMLSGCTAMDPDYAQSRPMRYSWSSGDRFGARDGYDARAGYGSATGNELWAIVHAAIYAPFVIADMLDEWLN